MDDAFAVVMFEFFFASLLAEMEQFVFNQELTKSYAGYVCANKVIQLFYL